jgi:uncharacterized membrane protein YeaQ/YmgE (transglycosylase-associated protein family)
MYAVEHASSPAAVNDAIRAAQAAAGAMLAGWLTERVLDTGFDVVGIGPLAGLLGTWLGSSLWSWGGWDVGPSLGSFAVLPALAGAFLVCSLLKLVHVGMAGPRW